MRKTGDASRGAAIIASAVVLVGTLLVLGIGVGIGASAGEETVSAQDEPIPIDDCAEIDTAGEYALTTNLTNRSTCLEITASDVVVDGAGYGIGGYGLEEAETESPQYGIHANDTENVTVRNVTVAGWGSNETESSDRPAGVSFENVTDGTIDNVTAFENEHGISLDDASGNTVTNVTGTENFATVTLWSSSDNTISNTTATANVDGIALWFSDGNTVVNNAVSGNYYNVVLGGSHGNAVLDTRTSDGEYGVYLQGSNWNTVSQMDATENVDGIALDDASANTLVENIVAGSDAGIVLESSSYRNTLAGNDLRENVNGISITESSHATTLTETTVESDDWDLTIDNSTDTTVTDLELADETVSLEGENVRLRSSGGLDGDTLSAPPNHDAVGPALDLEATGGSSVVDLTASYTGAGLGGVVDEETVGFWRLDDGGTWEPVDGSSIDTDNRTVSASLDESESESEFGTIAAFGLETYGLNVSVEANGDPVANTTVDVANPDTDGLVALQTVDDGAASFALQNGTYEVTADASGYDLATDTVTIDGDAAELTLELEPESEPEPEAENESSENQSNSMLEGSR